MWPVGAASTIGATLAATVLRWRLAERPRCRPAQSEPRGVVVAADAAASRSAPPLPPRFPHQEETLAVRVADAVADGAA